MNLCHDRNTIILSYLKTDIKSSDYPYNAKSDELEEKPESESETESNFEEGMAEKTN